MDKYGRKWCKWASLLKKGGKNPKYFGLIENFVPKKGETLDLATLCMGKITDFYKYKGNIHKPRQRP